MWVVTAKCTQPQLIKLVAAVVVFVFLGASWSPSNIHNVDNTTYVVLAPIQTAADTISLILLPHMLPLHLQQHLPPLLEEMVAAHLPVEPNGVAS